MSADPKNTENNNMNNINQLDESLWKIWRHKRYMVAILGFLGFMNVYALRTNLSIAIVDMTELKNVTIANGTSILKREFEWNSTMQGYVLSSFFYGYILTQIAGGYLATKLGGAKVFGFGIATTSFLTLVTPWVAETNVYFLIAVRTIEGALEGVTYPAIQEVWAHWAPPAEKSRLVTIAASGSYFGAVIAMPICSLLATAFGWNSIFYSFGTIGLIWYLIWTIVVGDRPSKDRWIKKKEVEFIESAINVNKSDEKLIIPWLKIFRSKAVLANTICLCSEAWGFYTFLTFLPQMMKSLLQFDLNKAGFLSALPYLTTCIMIQISGQISDYIISKKYLSTTRIRKLGIIIGFLAQSIFILLAGYWVSPIGTPFCLILAVGLGGCALSSVLINPLDLAPKFASVIFGISNTAGTVPGIVSPILTGYIVTDPTDIQQWRIVFYISSAIYLFGAIVSMIFTSGVKQPWAEDSDIPENTMKPTLTGCDNKAQEID